MINTDSRKQTIIKARQLLERLEEPGDRRTLFLPMSDERPEELRVQRNASGEYWLVQTRRPGHNWITQTRHRTQASAERDALQWYGA